MEVYLSPMHRPCVLFFNPYHFPHMFCTQSHADLSEFTYSTLLGALPQVIFRAFQKIAEVSSLPLVVSLIIDSSNKFEALFLALRISQIIA